MTFVALYQSNDDGEIDIVAGKIRTDDGLQVTYYLSLFGGNDDDAGVSANDSAQFWGNLLETDSARKMRSQFQALAQRIPLNTANLQRVQEAVENDIAWTVAAGIATDNEVVVTIPKLNTVRIEITAYVRNDVYRFAFEKAWGAE